MGEIVYVYINDQNYYLIKISDVYFGTQKM